MPFSTNLTRLLLRFGGSKPVTTCNCRIPARYEFMVLAFTFRTLTNQSIKINIFLWFSGMDMSSDVSVSHFLIIVFAVLYVLQVLAAMPRLPNSASVSAVSPGNSYSASSSLAQPPFFPYFRLPLTGVGQNVLTLPVAKEKK